MFSQNIYCFVYINLIKKNIFNFQIQKFLTKLLSNVHLLGIYLESKDVDFFILDDPSQPQFCTLARNEHFLIFCSRAILNNRK